MAEVAQTSIYLNERDREILAELQQRTGLSRSKVFRLAIQRLAQDDAERAARLVAISDEIKALA